MALTLEVILEVKLFSVSLSLSLYGYFNAAITLAIPEA